MTADGTVVMVFLVAPVTAADRETAARSIHPLLLLVLCVDLHGVDKRVNANQQLKVFFNPHDVTCCFQFHSRPELSLRLSKGEENIFSLCLRHRNGNWMDLIHGPLPSLSAPPYLKAAFRRLTNQRKSFVGLLLSLLLSLCPFFAEGKKGHGR